MGGVAEQGGTATVIRGQRLRARLIADTSVDLLAERGLRGLTHRAVDEAAGLPRGSTSNHARTRAALLEAAVVRLAEREAGLLLPEELPAPDGGMSALADSLATALHRSLTRHRELTLARYELALESTRRPELRACYDRTGPALSGSRSSRCCGRPAPPSPSGTPCR